MISSSDSNAPRANKRFLSSIIKSTDEHNKTILKAQAQAAEDLKRERREQERRQRRLRAEEAAAAERLRRHGRRRKVEDNEVWDRWDGRTMEKRKVSRNWENWDGYDDDADETDSERSRRRYCRSRSREKSSRSKKSRKDEEEDKAKLPSKRRRRHRSASTHSSRSRRSGCSRDGQDLEDRRKRPRLEDSYQHSPRSKSRSEREYHRSRRRRRSKSPKYVLDDLRETSSLEPSSPEVDSAEAREAELKQRLRESRIQSLTTQSNLNSSRNSPSRQPSSSRRCLTPMTISRSPTPGPQPSAHLPSKMDRYFEESYDPRLDVAPLLVPQVPATGLINDADFEGWDAMLELVRLRREDKAEKKRLERLGLLPSKDKKKAVVLNSSAAVSERWNGEGINAMKFEYSKKGTVREWDLGKEGI